MSKYIIDVGEGYIRHGLERTLAIPVRINEHEDHWMDTRIPVTPYTAPDLEQVKKEAYEEGYESGFVAGHLKAEKSGQKFYEDGYKRGLVDAWEAAKKIALDKEDGGLDTVAYCEIFGYGKGFGTILKKFSASEAIEKIRQYEQKQEEIKVGDVVRIKSAPEVEIWVTDIDEDGNLLSGLALKTVDDYCDMGDTYANMGVCKFERTGRHYNVPTVLEKMKEGQE